MVGIESDSKSDRKSEEKAVTAFVTLLDVFGENGMLKP
jgi:hypothetical protein